MQLNHLGKVAICCALISAPLIAFSDVSSTWTSKAVTQLSSTYDGADCIYFTLDGVSQADPVAPGDPWFAISRAQYGSKDAYAMLLAAKLSGQTVSVFTRGTLACGHPSVAQLIMQ